MTVTDYFQNNGLTFRLTEYHWQRIESG